MNHLMFSKIFFFSTYIMFFLQFLIVFLSTDKKSKESFLYYHKLYYYILLFMSLWSQIKCIITDPGKITHENNPSVIEFYLNVHEIAIKRAAQFNKTYGQSLFDKQNRKRFFKRLNEDEDEDEVISDQDESEYEPLTSITDDIMNNISNEYKTKLKRCFQCFVVRPPKSHHCSFCKGCILKMNHHNFWINNCVGQFTQKFFILFCFYSLLSNIEAIIIELYYEQYKSHILFKGKMKIALVSIQIFFNLIFSISNISMLKDQIDNFKSDRVIINMKEKRFEERRKLAELLIETFGCGFGISWFFPIKIGGLKPYYDKVLKGIKRAYN